MRKKSCEKCGRRVPIWDLTLVETLRATHWSPAEHAEWCDRCVDDARDAAEYADERRGYNAEQWERI